MRLFLAPLLALLASGCFLSRSSDEEPFHPNAVAELVPGEGRVPLAPESLGNVAREYLLAEAVVERTARIIDSAALYAMLGGTQVDLASETAAQRSADSTPAHARPRW